MCEDILKQYGEACNETVTSATMDFLLQDIQCRQDVACIPISNVVCRSLWNHVTMLLIVVYGQATIERGFTVKRQIDKYNLKSLRCMLASHT